MSAFAHGPRVISHPILSDLARFGVRLGLTRVLGLLTWLGEPHRDYAVVHVAGTNGKGSSTRMIASMLRAGGLRVGEATSPHLQNVNERIVVDGQEISDAELGALLEQLDGARRDWMSSAGVDHVDPEAALTYFEMITVAAFVHFSRSEIDVAVVEVGLGGRLDATNVVDPVVTAIVSIGLDHTEQLGSDLASIAAEKAGIIKPACPVVVGALAPAALRSVRTIARDREAPMLVQGENFRIHLERDQRMTFIDDAGTLSELELGLAGDHQANNAAVAIAAVRALPMALQIDDQAIATGLAAARHPGRLEWLADDLLVDCAHNGDGAMALAHYLRTLPEDGRRRTLLLGMGQDKDVRAVVVSLTGVVDRVLTTHCSHPRATSAGELASRIIGVDRPVLPAGPVEDALPLARERGDLVIVAGSIFLVGAVRDLVGAR
jgi:dihydrofolate synthase / folylpolyglutamate synthase